MRKDIDNIEIKEPPIQELKKRRSCLKHSCTTGFGCLLILIIIFLLLLRFAATPRPKELKAVPQSFPPSIPVYDEENIERITLLSGTQKNRFLEAAAYLPKLVLVPIFIYRPDYAPENIQDMLAKLEGKGNWYKFSILMRRPITEPVDQYEIEWTDLPANPAFVEEYYRTNLNNQNYKIETTVKTNSVIQLGFDKKTTQGVLYIEDDPLEEGTDSVVLTVTIPENND